jgi:hypothetical protein
VHGRLDVFLHRIRIAVADDLPPPLDVLTLASSDRTLPGFHEGTVLEHIDTLQVRLLERELDLADDQRVQAFERIIRAQIRSQQ